MTAITNMWKSKLDSKLELAEANGYRNLRTSASRTLLLSLTLILSLPLTLTAQGIGSLGSMTSSSQPSVYGSGYQVPLQFEGQQAPANQVALGVGVSTLYDDNVFAINSQRKSDEALSFDIPLTIARRTDHLTVDFNYTPFFLLYRQITELDRVNHAAGLTLSYQISSRVTLGMQDSLTYQNGIYPSLIDQPILSGSPSPIGLNGVIIPYTARTLSDTNGLFLTFRKNRRTSLTLTGGYNQVKYGTGSQLPTLRLYNGTGFSGGLTLQHYVTEHTALGILLLHQDTTYQGGVILGNEQRTQIESAYLSVASRLTPSVTFALFGGPQYVRSISQASPQTSLTAGFQASGGGNITKQVHQTALDLAVLRSVTDAGGFYTSALDTRATFGVRRRLVGRWEGNLHCGAAREDTSLFRSVNGRIDGVIAGVSITRPLLSRGSVLHISYDTMHQMSSGPLPVTANFDHNQIALGFDYQLKGINLGR